MAEYNVYADANEALRQSFYDNYKAANQSFVSLQDYATNTTFRTTTYSSNLAVSNSLADSIDAAPLQRILNTDGVVQIGNKILFINVNSKICYMLDAAYADDYADLIAGNTANSHITSFGFDEDVVGIIDQQLRGCSGTGRPSAGKTMKTTDFIGYATDFVSNRYVRINLQFEYKTWAIWFRLRNYARRDQEYFSNEWPYYTKTWVWSEWISAPFGYTQTIKYIKKCNSEVVESGVRNNSLTRIIQYTPYEGNRGLLKYSWQVFTKDFNGWEYNINTVLNTQGPFLFSSGY